MSRHGRLYDRLIHSAEWRGLRLEVLREQQGLCAWCKAAGRIVPATEVHHIVEAETGRTEREVRDLMFRRSNLVGLCHRCHAGWHRQRRYHSSDTVRQRQAERLDQWADMMAGRFGGGKGGGG